MQINCIDDYANFKALVAAHGGSVGPVPYFLGNIPSTGSAVFQNGDWVAAQTLVGVMILGGFTLLANEPSVSQFTSDFPAAIAVSAASAPLPSE